MNMARSPVNIVYSKFSVADVKNPAARAITKCIEDVIYTVWSVANAVI